MNPLLDSATALTVRSMTTRTRLRPGRQTGNGIAVPWPWLTARPPPVKPAAAAPARTIQAPGQRLASSTPASTIPTPDSHSHGRGERGGARRLSHSTMPSISSALPGSKVAKFEKIVESVKAATRPLPNCVAHNWMKAP